MGAWGYGFFQSDDDLDVTDVISDQASHLANDPNFTIWYPENRDQVVEKLNAGIFHQLLEKFKAKNWKSGIIYLGALSMQLGVKISDEEMLVLKKTLPRTRIHDEAKEQIRLGLEGYKNDGEAWDFKSPGLHETMAAGPPKGAGGNGFNVPQDHSKVPTPMPKDGEVEKDEGGTEAEGGKKKENKPPTGKDVLGDKAKLKAWFSS